MSAKNAERTILDKCVTKCVTKSVPKCVTKLQEKRVPRKKEMTMRKDFVSVVFDRKKTVEKRGEGAVEIYIYLGRTRGLIIEKTLKEPNLLILRTRSNAVFGSW